MSTTPARRIAPHADSLSGLDEPLDDLLSQIDPAVLDRARAICGSHAAQALDDADLWHVLGVLSTEHGNTPIALVCMWKAAALQPQQPSYLIDLAGALEERGRGADAIAASLRALTLVPADPDIYVRLARLLLHKDRIHEAAALSHEALRLDPDHVAAHRQTGDILDRLHRTEEALTHYERAVPLAPNNTGGWQRLGEARLQRREWDRAAAAFHAGLRSDGLDADLHVGLARVMLGQGLATDAVRDLRSALSLNPSHIAACRLLIIALELAGRQQDVPAAWLALGSALEARDRADEAIVAYREAHARKPEWPKPLRKLGAAYLARGEPREAARRLEQALALDPEHASTHVDLGRAWHLLGNAPRGWQELAWLCSPCDVQWRGFDQPMWDGSPLDGRTLLLWARRGSGLGDAIQHLRYVSRIARPGSIVLEIHEELVSLVERMPSLDTVIPRGAPLPAFDVHAPLAWLPVVLRDDREPYPGNVPYLTIDQPRIDHWRWRIAPTRARMIGLAWAGAADRANARRRFAPLAAFAPLARVNDLRFISLQLGPQATERLDLPDGFRVERLRDEPRTIVDTAALLMNLDLVITVDTMLAHLAGACAVPVWTVLSHVADWRWLTGDTTPWYSTMRLFRQTRAGDWSDVFERVRAALACECELSFPIAAAGRTRTESMTRGRAQ